MKRYTNRKTKEHVTKNLPRHLPSGRLFHHVHRDRRVPRLLKKKFYLGTFHPGGFSTTCTGTDVYPAC